MRLFLAVSAVLLVLGSGAAGVLWAWLWIVSRGLPDTAQLAQYKPPITSRVHAGDGTLVAEFARQHRAYVPVEAVPRQLIDAFISAEDKNFFTHNGIDVGGILRAASRIAYNRIRGQGGLQGGSTITQQVAKNMLLSSERTLMRKIKEAMVARRIERIFSKEQILDLYMNEIYLGGRSYGVGSASLNYFGKSLSELTLAESALLAALPKSPSSINPYVRPEAAIQRRDWVLDRMTVNGYVSQEEASLAKADPLTTVKRLDSEEIRASRYFVEEIRRKVLRLSDTPEQGEKVFYEGGLSIRSTLDTRLQLLARKALREGLENYDRRQGWRGAAFHLDTLPQRNWGALLDQMELPAAVAARGWLRAVVLQVAPERILLGLSNDQTVEMDKDDLTWIAKSIRDRKTKKTGKNGATNRPVPAALVRGDVVLVSREEVQTKDADNTATPPPDTPDTGKENDTPRYHLQQLPDVEGALVAMDPHTGRVLAMVGGYAFERSQFNRAVQARRQPGSSFKPFVYAAALDNGFTPVSKILDAPFVIDTPQGLYKPRNYSDRFYGLSTLRLGLEKSRNLMTVRLAQEVGMEQVSDYAHRFGLYEHRNRFLSAALGAGETTPMKMTAAYSMLVNGGKRITPTLLDRIQDRNGKTVFRRDSRRCPECDIAWNNQPPPNVADQRDQVVDAVTAYQIVSMMEGVIKRGTARLVRAVGKPIAGKTGTTNDFLDAWFVGFSPDLVACIWVGFDSPRTLGTGESGGRVAAPIFRDFMKGALKNTPSAPFRIPPGVRLVEIDAVSGKLPSESTRSKILEAFRPGTEPNRADDSSTVDESDDWLNLLREGTSLSPAAPGQIGPETPERSNSQIPSPYKLQSPPPSQTDAGSPGRLPASTNQRRSAPQTRRTRTPASSLRRQGRRKSPVTGRAPVTGRVPGPEPLPSQSETENAEDQFLEEGIY